MAAETSTRRRLPGMLYALAWCAFAIGTNEFLPMGMLPTLGRELDVPPGTAGLLVTGYALAVVLSAPLLTAALRRVPRVLLLLGLMVLLVAGTVLAVVASSFAVLLVSRLLTACTHGVFYSVGARVAAEAVPNRPATAISVLFSGLTVAMAISLPLATFMADTWGWRAPFVGVTLLSLAGLLLLTVTLRGTTLPTSSADWRTQAAVLRQPQLALALGLSVLGFGGFFTTFGYLTYLLQQVTGLAPTTVSILLVGYGAAVAVGNTVGGRLANTRPLTTVASLFILQAAILAVFGVTMTIPAVTLAILAPMGTLHLATGPGLQLLAVRAVVPIPGGADVASGLNQAAFNLGIAAGTALGSYELNAGAGPSAIPWSGTAILTAAALSAILALRATTGSPAVSAKKATTEGRRERAR